MSIGKILDNLEKSWERKVILLKIKEGFNVDEIVNDFFVKNENQIKELSNLLRQEDIDLLNQVEQLSNCESKLINKISNLNYLENNVNHHTVNKKKILPSYKSPSKRISSFMINWSNKVVVIALLTISIISLSKQAWA